MGDSIQDSVQTWVAARLAELSAGGMRTLEEFKARIEPLIAERRLTIRVRVAGDRLAFSALVDRGGKEVLERFELDPRRIEPPPSTARREIEARKYADQALVDGIVDALELRHGMSQAHERLRGFGGPDGPGELFYDLIGVGAQTLRELLHLNARANRRLLAALRTLMPAADGSVVVAPAGAAGAALVLDAEGTNTALALENRRREPLTVDLPCGVSVCAEDGTRAQTLALEWAQRRVTLARRERREIEVCLTRQAIKNMSTGTWLGELVLGTDGGAPARVAVIVTKHAEAT